MLPRLTLPPSPATLALIALAFALPGLAGHDLWKTHDAIGLGIVHDMATSGSPLVPRIAGMPWLFDPPLYHWLAAGFGSALQFFTEFHSAARLASGVLVLAAFWLIYVAARDGAAEHRTPTRAVSDLRSRSSGHAASSNAGSHARYAMPRPSSSMRCRSRGNHPDPRPPGALVGQLASARRSAPVDASAAVRRAIEPPTMARHASGKARRNRRKRS